MKASDIGTRALIAIVAVVAVVLFGAAFLSYAKTDRVTITVTGKESVSTDGGHEYRVYTKQDTYKVGDSWIHPRFNSADLYGRLGDNKTYSCEKYGWRIPFLSQFENLLNCQEA